MTAPAARTLFKTLDDIDPKGKRVLVRTDLNVPMKDGRITDTTRIDGAARTVGELARRGGRVIVLSHFGRPKGRDASLSLAPLARPLAAALGRARVGFAPDCIGPEVRKAVAALADGDVLLLENLRFHQGEETNDPAFVAALASLGDLYVNDAFSAAHRAHASTEGLAHRLPAAAGRLMEAELDALHSVLGTPRRPVAAIVGGAKVSTKIGVLTHLLDKVDVLVIGGAMANTFLAAQGKPIGKSLAEADLRGVVLDILGRAAEKSVEIVLPVDAVVAPSLKAGVEARAVPLDRVGADDMILDVGPDTVALIAKKLATCRTLLWNGPMGAFEFPPFDAGTNAVAAAVASLTRTAGLISVAGGGDTAAALAHAGVGRDITYISAAGGAFLEWIEGRALPGVAALTR